VIGLSAKAFRDHISLYIFSRPVGLKRTGQEVSRRREALEIVSPFFRMFPLRLVNSSAESSLPLILLTGDRLCLGLSARAP